VQRLGIAFYTEGADEEVTRVVREAARALGAEEARPECLDAAYDLEMKLIGADGGDGLRQYLRELGSSETHPLLNGWLDKLEAYRMDVTSFAACWNQWQAYRAELLGFAQRFGAILCPAYIHPALPHGTSTEDANFRGFRHTMAFNVAGWPAAVVRCGTSRDGLPIAVQVAAPPWREDVALAVAMRLEEQFS